MAMPAKVFLPVVSRIAFASSTNQPRPLVTLQRLHNTVVDSPSISKADANFPHGSRKQARDGSWLKTLKAQLDAKAAFQISVDRCPFGLAIAFLHSQDPFRT